MCPLEGIDHPFEGKSKAKNMKKTGGPLFRNENLSQFKRKETHKERKERKEGRGQNKICNFPCLLCGLCALLCFFAFNCPRFA